MGLYNLINSKPVLLLSVITCTFVIMAPGGEQDTIKPIITRVPTLPQDTIKQRMPQTPPDTSVQEPPSVTVPADTFTPVLQPPVDTIEPQSPGSDTINDQTKIIPSRNNQSPDTVDPSPVVSPVTTREPVQRRDTFEVQEPDTATPEVLHDLNEFNIPVYLRAPMKEDFKDPDQFTFADIKSDSLVNPYLGEFDPTLDIHWRESIFTGHELQPKEVQWKEQDIGGRWVFPSLVLVLILFTIVKRLHFKKFKLFASSAVAERIYIQIAREESSILSPVTILLGFTSMILWSVFIFQLAEFYNILPDIPAVELVLTIIAGMLIFFIGKLVLYIISGFLLNQLPLLSKYLFTIVLFFSLSGLLLFPVVVGYEYIKVVPAQYLIYAGLATAVIAFVIRGVRGLVLASDYGGLSKLYLFLYFCALEIVPLLLLYKAIEGRI